MVRNQGLKANSKLKPYQTRKWRKIRAEFIQGKCCEECGSTENLSIHHTRKINFLNEYRRVAHTFFKNYFKNGRNQGELKNLRENAIKDLEDTVIHDKRFRLYLHDGCPLCGTKVGRPRTRKKPKYHCSNCYNDFEEPVKTYTLVGRRVFNLFQKHHKEEIDKKYAEVKKEIEEEYYSLKNVIVLCKSCHYALHRGYILCQVCKEKYHKSRFTMCWDCNVGTGFREYEQLLIEKEEKEWEEWEAHWG